MCNFVFVISFCEMDLGAFRIHLKMQLGRLIVLNFQNLPKLMSFAVGRDETNPAWIILTSNGWNLVDIFPPGSL